MPDGASVNSHCCDGGAYVVIHVRRSVAAPCWRILAIVPPDGAAANLVRETSSGIVVAPDDVDGMRAALVDLHGRFANGGLASVELAKRDEDRLSRRARVEELAALVQEIA